MRNKCVSLYVGALMAVPNDISLDVNFLANAASTLARVDQSASRAASEGLTNAQHFFLSHHLSKTQAPGEYTAILSAGSV